MDKHIVVREEDIEFLMSCSYKSFHARGLDYICLRRSDETTLKVYLLDGDASRVPEVVNPHDHRYGFTTMVLAGEMVDYRYIRGERGDVYEAFDYLTPLCGGDGFTWRGEERLEKVRGHLLMQNDWLYTQPIDLHTIRMLQDQTCLLLEQYADVVPVGQPTSCWTRRGAPRPDTSGLYDRFTEAEFREKLALVQDIFSNRGIRMEVVG